MRKHQQAISFLLILCFSFIVEARINITASSDKDLLSQEIFLKISNEHFFKNKNMGDINTKLLNALLKKLDSEKIYFTKNEISLLRKNFSTSSKEVDINSSYELVNLYFNRLIEATNYQLKEVKRKRFDFEKNDSLKINEDLKQWPNNKLMLRQTWRKLAKNDVLTSILVGQELDEATETIQKRYKNRLRRISQRNEEDVFSIIMNNLTGLYDPHSSYFSPKSAEDFEMTMSLKLEGIGALLTTEDDYPIIVSLVPGGPAEKSGKINPDDKIVKITQVQSPRPPAVDVVGWRIDEVVQLIRGSAGTEVELELIPAKTEDFSERKFVTITREEVKLEEQAAKSRIVEIKNNSNALKIGIINLPTFYIDFNAFRERNPDFKSSSKDVQIILDGFNAQGVDGVIVDLRGNSGGSLYEANKLTGLFVASGATLQVKKNSGYIRPWRDAQAKQVWTKPMAVMVDRYSASASEIFAGAVQDYQRGLIIGHRTFGKGTVQVLDDLSSGQLKITESKFYRITGSGMQSRGINPDITLPATWDIEEIGESSLDAALPWDKISPIRFKKFPMDFGVVGQLKEAHLQRLTQNPNLQYILDIRKRFDFQKDKKILSLNIKTRRSDKIERQKWALETENKRRSELSLTIFENYEALKEFNENKEEIDIDVDSDYLLHEGTQILSDYIYLKSDLLLSEAA